VDNYCSSIPSLLAVLDQRQGRHLGRGQGGHLPPLILKTSDFLCFCTHNFVFFIFRPPLGSRSKFCTPPLEKMKWRPWPATEDHAQSQFRRGGCRWENPIRRRIYMTRRINRLWGCRLQRNRERVVRYQIVSDLIHLFVSTTIRNAFKFVRTKTSVN